MVNATPSFDGTTNVVNGSSDLILELCSLEASMHSRIAVGVSSLSLNLPVIISAEVALS